jgi:hypothetical protein
MLNRKNIVRFFTYFFSVVCLFLLFSCTGTRIVKYEDVDVRKEGPLANAYHKLIIHDFESDHNLEKISTHAVAACESATLNELLEIGAIHQIEKSKSRTLRQDNALILKTYITADGAGPTNLSADVRLIDAATGRTVRVKHLSTAGRPTGKTRTSPVKGQSVSTKLGQMIAQYVSETMGGN